VSAGLVPCGTPGAYRRHQRRGEAICRACKDWYNANRALTRDGGTGHLVLVPGVIEAGLCGCPLNEAHWAGQEAVS
jgi:hypothetical protein